jgi:type III secretion protein J
MTHRVHGWRSLAALLLVAGLAACSRQVELMAALPATEANEVIAALQNAGIGADKVSGKEGLAAVKVAAGDVGRAVDLLREKGLPRERFAGMGQVFKKEGLISSPLEERARYVYALSQELGATLSQIDGVVFARVHVVLPERTSVGETPVASSAAVFIKHQEGYNLETLQPLVRRLVSHSIPGLSPEKVSIVLVSAQPVRPRNESGAGWGATSAATTALVVLMLVLGIAALAGGGFLVWKQGWLLRFLRRPPPAQG